MAGTVSGGTGFRLDVSSAVGRHEHLDSTEAAGEPSAQIRAGELRSAWHYMPGDGHTKARIAPLTYPDADLTQAAGYHLAQRGRAKHRDRRSLGGRAQVPPEPNRSAPPL